MIVSCPNCGARYRLAAASIASNARMRCASCDHRWQPAAEEPAEPEAIDPIAPTAPPPVPDPAAAEPDADEPEATEPDPASGGAAVLRTIIAIVIGSALAMAAGGLWIARIDPALDLAQVPLAGEALARLGARPLPIKVTFTAVTTPLASGDRLLEIRGRVRNTGTAAIAMPDLEARLAGPAGTVRRWRIAAPAAQLAPGAAADFASTASGFPADARLVGIRPAG